MIGYKVYLKDDSASRGYLNSSINLIHKFHPETQGTREKQIKKALKFYRNTLRMSDARSITLNEKLRIKQIKDNIAEWK